MRLAVPQAWATAYEALARLNAALHVVHIAHVTGAAVCHAD